MKFKKTLLILALVLSFSAAHAERADHALIIADNTAAYISAPTGWEIDSDAARDTAVIMVLLPEGQNLGSFDGIIFGDIGGPAIKSPADFAKEDAAQYSAQEGDLKLESEKELKRGTNDFGSEFIVQEYTLVSGDKHITAYIQINDKVLSLTLDIAPESKNKEKYKSDFKKLINRVLPAEKVKIERGTEPAEKIDA